MTTPSGPDLKQRLADALGARLLEDSSLALVRGRDQLRVEMFGTVQDDRHTGFWIRCGLDRSEKQDGGADARPRVDGLPALLLRRETAKDRKGKRFKLNRDVRTTDPDFNEVVHVESVAPDKHLQAVLSSPETLRLTRTMLEQQCELITINKRRGELQVKTPAYVQDESSLPGLIEALEWWIEQARLVKASLPVFVGDANPARRYPLLKVAYYFELLLFVLTIVSGIIMQDFVDDESFILLYCGGLGAVVLLMPLFWLVAHGHPKGAAHFRGMFYLALFVFPLAAFTIGAATNSLFDTSRPQAHRTVAVSEPRCNTDDDYVDVRDWRGGRESVLVEIDYRWCDIIEPGDTLIVVIREGFWGFAWFEDVQMPR